MPAHNINVNCRAQLTSTANATWRDYYSALDEKQAEIAQFRHFLSRRGALLVQNSANVCNKKQARIAWRGFGLILLRMANETYLFHPFFRNDILSLILLA